MTIRELSLVVAAGAVLAAPGVAAAQPSSDAPAAESLPATIPIFPLQDVMLFPEVGRPLHIFEPRYREMIADALEGDRIIGMVMLQPGHEAEYYGRPPIHALGCAGRITDFEELPDGRYFVVLEGLTKFRVTVEDESRAYRLANVEAVADGLRDDDREALRRYRPRLLQALAAISPPPPPEPTPDELPDERLVNLVAQTHPMKPEERLALLGTDGPLARAEMLVALLKLTGTVASKLPRP